MRRKLMAYHDGELGVAVNRKIGKHLETCQECSDLLESLERGDLAAGRAGVPEPGSEYWATFTERVMEKVGKEARTSPAGPRPDPARTGFSPLRLAPAVSIALVVVVAAGVLLKVHRPAGPTRSMTTGETVMKEENPPVMADRLRERSDAEEADYPSSPAGSAPAKGLKEPGTEADRRPDSLKTARAVSPMETGTAADESVRPDTNEGKVDSKVRDMDDPANYAPAYAAEEQEIRSGLVSPAPEAARKTEVFSGIEENVSKKRAIDDGSWGQLAFARELEEEGRHSESEEILDDLLERNTEPPVREQASLLLVSVLANQNRLPEARQVLEGAQQMYPGNMMIQNYKLGEE